MGSDRAEVATLVDTAQRLRRARRACRQFLELHDEQTGALPLVQVLLDELIEPGRARLESALGEPRKL